MEIPKSLVELADQIDIKKRQEARKVIVDKWIQKTRHYLNIARRLKNGLEYAEKIFDWAREFSKTPEGKKLIQIGVKYSHREGIYFFTEKASGKGSRALGVSKKGIWWIQFGCMAREYYVQTPEDLASEVEPEILKLACETLEDGRVWKCIEEQIQRRLSE